MIAKIEYPMGATIQKGGIPGKSVANTFFLRLMEEHAQVELPYPFGGGERGIEVEPMPVSRILTMVGFCGTKTAKSVPMLRLIEDECELSTLILDINDKTVVWVLGDILGVIVVLPHLHAPPRHETAESRHQTRCGVREWGG